MEARVISAPRIDPGTFDVGLMAGMRGAAAVRVGAAGGVGAGAGGGVVAGTAGGGLAAGAFVAATLISPGPGRPVFVSVCAGRRFAAEKKSAGRMRIRRHLPPCKDVKKTIS
jgi:hypothetical protein